MCGNGGRCITAFAKNLEIIDTHTTFEGIDGAHEASVQNNGDIRLRLVDVTGIDRLEDGYRLNTGSPHFIKFVNNIEQIPVELEGAKIRHQERFGTEGINVNYVELGSARNEIKVRTFERGVEGETWSCGTGAAAAAITTYFHSRHDNLSYEVRTRGGELKLSFKTEGKRKFKEVYLTGPASHVYDGAIDIVI